MFAALFTLQNDIARYASPILRSFHFKICTFVLIPHAKNPRQWSIFECVDVELASLVPTKFFIPRLPSCQAEEAEIAKLAEVAFDSIVIDTHLHDLVLTFGTLLAVIIHPS